MLTDSKNRISVLIQKVEQMMDIPRANSDPTQSSGDSEARRASNYKGCYTLTLF